MLQDDFVFSENSLELCLEWNKIKKAVSGETAFFLKLVGPVGIEPTSSVPETDVLSIERRAHVPKEREK